MEDGFSAVFGQLFPSSVSLYKAYFIAIFAIMNSLNGLEHEKGQNKNNNFRHSL